MRLAKKKTMRTWQIRSNVMKTKKNADVPMLYNNICKSPPRTERPAAASLKPYDTAAPLLLVDEALELLPVDVDDPRELASAVVLQMKVPWMTFPVPASAWKPLQSIWAVDWMLKPPLTLTRAGKLGVVKFPEKSMAPPTVVKAGKLMEPRAVLLAIWSAPPTVLRRGIEMLANLALATKAKEPWPVAVEPTEVKLGAAMEDM